MEIGLATGLAQSMGFDQQIQDMRYRQEMMKRQQDMNAAKAKMFSDSLEFQNASNSFDAPKVRDMNAKIVQEIGDYVQSNPDWETNVQKMSYVKLLKNKLKDNPEVLRAVHSDNNYKELLKDLQEVAKNPNQHDQDAYNSYLSKWDNYLKFGNQDGEQAALAEGAKPFTYVKPKDFIDMPATLVKLGNEFKDYDIVPTKFGGYYTKPKEEQLNAMADNFIKQNERQVLVTAKQMGLQTPEQVKKMVKDQIAAGIQKQFKMGDPAEYARLGMERKRLDLEYQKLKGSTASGGTPVWKYFTSDKNPYGRISDKVISEVYGNTLPVKVHGSDGKTIDLTGYKFNSTGEYINEKGATFLPGTVLLSIEDAQAKGIYENNTIFKDKVTDPFRSIAEEVEVEGKNGEMVKAIKLKTQVNINREDPIAEQKFKAAIEPTKFVSESDSWENNYEQPQQQMFRIAGVDVPVGSKIRNKKTGQVGILQPDGSIK